MQRKHPLVALPPSSRVSVGNEPRVIDEQTPVILTEEGNIFNDPAMSVASTSNSSNVEILIIEPTPTQSGSQHLAVKKPVGQRPPSKKQTSLAAYVPKKKTQMKKTKLI